MREFYGKIKDKIYIPLIISVILIGGFLNSALFSSFEANVFKLYCINYQRLGFCRDGLIGSLIGFITNDLSMIYTIGSVLTIVVVCILIFMFSVISWKSTDNVYVKAAYFVSVYMLLPLFFDSGASGLVIFFSLFGVIMLCFIKSARCLWLIPVLSVVATLIDIDYIMTFFSVIIFMLIIKFLQNKNAENVKYMAVGIVTIVATVVTAMASSFIKVPVSVLETYLGEIITVNNSFPKEEQFVIYDGWFDFYGESGVTIWHFLIPVLAVLAAYVVNKCIKDGKVIRVTMAVSAVLVLLGIFVDSFWCLIIPVYWLYIVCHVDSDSKGTEELYDRFKKLGFEKYVYIADVVAIYEIMLSKQSIAGKMLCLILVFAATFIVLWVKKSRADCAKKYLMLIVPLSLVTTLLVTPTYYKNSPDEGRHYTRIYSISLGQLLPNSEGEGIVNTDIIPKDSSGEFTIVTMLKEFDQHADFDSYEYVNFYGAAIYPFVGYIPQVIALCITRLFTDNVFLLMYGTRFGSWVLSVLIIYFAIKKTPLYKNAFMLFALTSMIVREMVTINVDGVSFACSLLLLAEVIYYCHNETEKISLKDKVIIFILGVFLALSKTLYAPLILTVFALKRTNFASRFGKNVYATVTFVGAVAIALMWVASVGSLIDGTTEGYGVNGAEQTKYILSDIFNYINIMIRTIGIYGSDWFNDIFGRRCLKYYIPTLAVTMGAIAVFISVLKEKVMLKSKSLIGLFLVAGFIVVFCSLTGEYIQYTQVGADTIIGVQGRYFIPIYMFVAIALAQILRRIFSSKRVGEKVTNLKAFARKVAVTEVEYGLFYYYILITIVSLCVVNM